MNTLQHAWFTPPALFSPTVCQPHYEHRHLIQPLSIQLMQTLSVHLILTLSVQLILYNSVFILTAQTVFAAALSDAAVRFKHPAGAPSSRPFEWGDPAPILLCVKVSDVTWGEFFTVSLSTASYEKHWKNHRRRHHLPASCLLQHGLSVWTTRLVVRLYAGAARFCVNKKGQRTCKPPLRS